MFIVNVLTEIFTNNVHHVITANEKNKKIYNNKVCKRLSVNYIFNKQ